MLNTLIASYYLNQTFLQITSPAVSAPQLTCETVRSSSSGLPSCSKTSQQRPTSDLGGKMPQLPSLSPLMTRFYPLRSDLLGNTLPCVFSIQALGLSSSPDHPNSLVFLTILRSRFPGSSSLLHCIGSFAEIWVARVSARHFAGSQDVMSSLISSHNSSSWTFFFPCGSSNNCFNASSSTLYFLMRLGPRIMVTRSFSSVPP